jgi:hypothetical protein
MPVLLYATMVESIVGDEFTHRIAPKLEPDPPYRTTQSRNTHEASIAVFSIVM